MKLWRISNCLDDNGWADLKGIGGSTTPGRWHNRGIPVVYLAESPALAMLEVLVHFEMAPEDAPTSYQLLEVEYTNRKGINRLDTQVLSDDWREDTDFTRSVGDEWLSGINGLLLRVPSAVAPHSFNYLFNPRHQLAANTKIISCTQHPYDSRLTEKLS